MTYEFRPGDLVTPRNSWGVSLVDPDNTDKVVGGFNGDEVAIIIHVGGGFPCILLTERGTFGATAITYLRRLM